MIAKPTPEILKLANRILRKGGIIAVPTETFYALCADARDESAIEEILSLKGRQKAKGIPLVVKNLAQLSLLCKRPNKATRILAQKLWPGPLSLVFENKKLPRILEGERKSVVARVSSSKILQTLMKSLNFPLTATSANISGGENPRSAENVFKSFGERVEMIIDGGRLKGKKASTIVDARGKKPIIIRDGAVSKAKIRNALR